MRKPKKARLVRQTFYRDPELNPLIGNVFDVVGFNPDSQIPIGLKINGQCKYFADEEVAVVEWDDEKA